MSTHGKGWCPICGKPSDSRHRPFCSRRCADVDLHRWLGEGYRVPTDEAPANGLASPDDEDGQER
jgi:hypothetical protein